MNTFERQVSSVLGGELRSVEISILQLNIGLRCNQSCRHCHQEASPERTEMMPWPVMEDAVRAAVAAGCRQVDITGGAPELHPRFRDLVRALRGEGIPVQTRTNLTVLLESGMEGLPAFLRAHRVQLLASLPFYADGDLCLVRGPGVFDRSIEGLRRLNAVGYGIEPDLPLTLVHNHTGPLPLSGQKTMEKDYREELRRRFGLEFTRLITITNIPVGRLRGELSRCNTLDDYLRLLRDSFNPVVVRDLVCRTHISADWNGNLYDCDFNLGMGLPVVPGLPGNLSAFDPAVLAVRRIATGNHCFACTAGSGSS